MLEEEARVGGDLGGIAPRIFAGDEDRAAFGVGAGEVSYGEGIGGDVDADGFHRGDAAARGHLRAVERCDAEGFVIGLEGADAVLFEQGCEVAEDVEESGDGGTGVAGQKVDSALAFEGPFDE